MALSILKIIEGYDMGDPSTFNLSVHRLDEAMRFSYAARAELGDPDFFSYMTDYETKMLKSKTAEDIRGRILDDRTQDVRSYNPKMLKAPENHGTSHVVAADDSGMTITLTSTVNLLFGSRLVVPETGTFFWLILFFGPFFFHFFFHILTHADQPRRNNERRNERLLHPRCLQRIWFCSVSHKLHPTQQTPSLIYHTHHCRISKRYALYFHRRRWRFANHHVDSSSPLARVRPQ